MALFPEKQEIRVLGNKTYVDNLKVMLAKSMVTKGVKIKINEKTCQDYCINQPPINWWASEKLDGIRAVWDGEKFLSRGSASGAAKVYSYVPKWFEDLIPKGIALDGEIWVGRNKFQEAGKLSSLIPGGKYSESQINELWKDVKFMIFDIPSYKGLFEERMSYLSKTIKPNDNIRLVKHHKIKSDEDLTRMYDDLTSHGAEGVMLRAPHSPYLTKRTNLLLKMKIIDDSEALVVGYTNGTGKYDKVLANGMHMLGSLNAELVEHGKRTGVLFNIGTGFTDEQRTSYCDINSPHSIPIGSLVSFSFMEKTTDGIPRHPSFRGLRYDQFIPSKVIPETEINNFIIEQFNEIIKGLKSGNDKNKGFKIGQYNKIVKSLTKIEKPIVDTQVALEELRKCGHKFTNENYEKNKCWKSSILTKIDTIIKTGGQLEEVKMVKQDPRSISIHMLTKVPHIGDVKAGKLFDMGITTIEELKLEVESSNEDILTPQQKVGLKYLEDLSERIPRKEMKLWEQMVQRITKKLSGKTDDTLVSELAGSFRRKKSTSGDIDVLLTSDNHVEFYTKFVNELMKEKIIVDVFSKGETQIMAVAKLKVKGSDMFRHIDIFGYSRNIYPFALLHATGSDEHNKTMRTISIEQGYSLSQYGLKRDGLIQDLNINSEKDIFKFLKMEYVDPTKR